MMTSRKQDDDHMSVGEWIRLAYDDAGCPPPETFLVESLARLSAEERARLEAHAGACPACTAERVLAAGFEDPPEMTEELASVVSRLRASPRPPARRLLLWVPAAAAAAALALSVGLWRGAQAPPLPERAPERVRRGAIVTLVSPVGTQREAPDTLRWQAVDGAVRYTVRLERVDGELLWSANVTDVTVALRGSVVQELHPAVTYFWVVEALDAEGRTVGRSERQSFTVRPN